jgi:hypothetical protein
LSFSRHDVLSGDLKGRLDELKLAYPRLRRWLLATPPNKVLGHDVLIDMGTQRIDVGLFAGYSDGSPCNACLLRNRVSQCGHRPENKLDEAKIEENIKNGPSYPDPVLEAVVENRREGEPHSVEVGTANIPLPPAPPPDFSQIRRARGVKKAPIEDLFYKYEDNKRFYLKKFKHFTCLYKLEWADKRSYAMSLGLSVTKLKKQYEGRLSRDFPGAIHCVVQRSVEPIDISWYDLKRLYQKFPTTIVNGEQTYFNFLLESKVFTPFVYKKKKHKKNVRRQVERYARKLGAQVWSRSISDWVNRRTEYLLAHEI